VSNNILYIFCTENLLPNFPAIANGDVALVDVRTKPGRVEKIMQCFEMSARTISLHPLDENLFMTCNRYG
jgi:hypothetical protein